MYITFGNTQTSQENKLWKWLIIVLRSLNKSRILILPNSQFAQLTAQKRIITCSTRLSSWRDRATELNNAIWRVKRFFSFSCAHRLPREMNLPLPSSLPLFYSRRISCALKISRRFASSRVISDRKIGEFEFLGILALDRQKSKRKRGKEIALVRNPSISHFKSSPLTRQIHSLPDSSFSSPRKEGS